MAKVLNFLDDLPETSRRRPEELKHEGGWYKAERRVWHDDSVCKNFQESAAWHYLFGIAEPRGGGRQRKLNGHEFKVERGQVLTSVAFLARYFEWSPHRVDRFLERLARYGRITMIPLYEPSTRDRHPTGMRQGGRQGVGQLGVLITVCNYAFYQDGDKVRDTERQGGRQACDRHATDSLRRKKEEVGTESLTDSETPHVAVGTESRTDSETPDQRESPTRRGESDSPANAESPSPRRRRRRPLSPELMREFETWWQEWKTIPGSRRNHGDAEEAFRAAREGRYRDPATLAVLIRRVRLFLAFHRADGTPLQYIKHPSTWLNKGCWLDDLPIQHEGNGHGGRTQGGRGQRNIYAELLGDLEDPEPQDDPGCVTLGPADWQVVEQR